MNVNDYNKENISENISRSQKSNKGSLKSVLVTDYKSDQESKGKIDEAEVDKIEHLQAKMTKINEKISEKTLAQSHIKTTMAQCAHDVELYSQKQQELAHTRNEIAALANEKYHIGNEIDDLENKMTRGDSRLKELTPHVTFDETLKKRSKEFINNRIEKYEHAFLEEGYLAGGRRTPINYEKIGVKVTNDFEKFISKYDIPDKVNARTIFNEELERQTSTKELHEIQNFVKTAIDLHEGQFREQGHLAAVRAPMNYDRIKTKVSNEIKQHLQKYGTPAAFEIFMNELDTQIGVKQNKLSR